MMGRTEIIYCFESSRAFNDSITQNNKNIYIYTYIHIYIYIILKDHLSVYFSQILQGLVRTIVYTGSLLVTVEK